MIDPKEFYFEHEKMTADQKRRVWNRISKNLKSKISTKFIIEFRSFAFGFASSLMLLFAALGIFSLIQNRLYENQPDVMRLNNIYKQTISEMEEILPSQNKLRNASIIVDEKIAGKKDKLANLNQAINEINSESRFELYSSLKQDRLLNLYRMKLNVIEEIISIEENTK